MRFGLSKLFAIFFFLFFVSVSFAAAPTTSFNYNQVPYTADANITLTCTLTDSNCIKLGYRIDGGAWTEIPITGTSFSEGFDDGDLTSNYTWGTVLGTWVVDTNSKHDVTHGLKSNGGGNWLLVHELATPVDSNSRSISYWQKRSAGVADNSGLWISYNDTNARGVNDFSVNLTGGTATLQMYIDSVNTSTALGAYTNGTWYKTVISIDANGRNANIKFYDSDGTTLIGETYKAIPMGKIKRLLFTAEAYTQFDTLEIDSTTSSSNFVYNFNYPTTTGTHSIDYNSTAIDLNVEATKTSSFTLYGYGRLNFYNETNSSPLVGVTASFNGVNYSSGANNYIDFNLQGITTGRYLFEFSKSGYSSRHMYLDLNQFSSFNYNQLLLLDTNNDTLNFQLKQPTTLTNMADSKVIITKDSNYAYITYTDSEGKMTLNLNPDQNAARYRMQITYGTTTYDWNGLTLTVKIPLKENDTTTSITPFDISVTGVTNYQDYNLTADKDYIIWSDLQYAYPYSVSVGDYNSVLYVDRVYDLWLNGLLTTYTLQPYLLLTADASAITMLVKNEFNSSVQDILIKVYKQIGGTKTLIASRYSSVTGSAVFYLIAGDKYELELLYEDTVLFSTDNYLVANSTIYFYLNSLTNYLLSTDFGNKATVEFLPYLENLIAGNNVLTQNVSQTDLNFVIVRLYNYVDNNYAADKNYFYTTSANCNESCSFTQDLTTIGFDNNNFFWVEVTAYTDANGSKSTLSRKYLWNFTQGINLVNLLTNIRSDFGCSTNPVLPCGLSTIVAIILSVVAVGLLIMFTGQVNPLGLSVAALIILGFFAYVGWFYWVIYIVLVMVILVGGVGKFTGGGY